MEDVSLKKKIVLSFLVSAVIVALLSAFLFVNFAEIRKETLFLETTEALGIDALDTGQSHHAGRFDEEWPWALRYLASFGVTISGGTSEIQRNIVAERVLGLPRR